MAHHAMSGNVPGPGVFPFPHGPILSSSMQAGAPTLFEPQELAVYINQYVPGTSAFVTAQVVRDHNINSTSLVHNLDIILEGLSIMVPDPVLRPQVAEGLQATVRSFPHHGLVHTPLSEAEAYQRRPLREIAERLGESEDHTDHDDEQSEYFSVGDYDSDDGRWPRRLLGEGETTGRYMPHTHVENTRCTSTVTNISADTATSDTGRSPLASSLVLHARTGTARLDTRAARAPPSRRPILNTVSSPISPNQPSSAFPTLTALTTPSMSPIAGPSGVKVSSPSLPQNPPPPFVHMIQPSVPSGRWREQEVQTVEEQPKVHIIQSRVPCGRWLDRGVQTAQFEDRGVQTDSYYPA